MWLPLWTELLVLPTGANHRFMDIMLKNRELLNNLEKKNKISMTLNTFDGMVVCTLSWVTNIWSSFKLWMKGHFIKGFFFFFLMSSHALNRRNLSVMSPYLTFLYLCFHRFWVAMKADSSFPFWQMHHAVFRSLCWLACFRHNVVLYVQSPSVVVLFWRVLSPPPLILITLFCFISKFQFMLSS